MKQQRNVWGRAFSTAWQTAIPVFLSAVVTGLESGEYGMGMVLAALVTAGAAGLSAAKNVIANRNPERQNAALEE